MNKSTKRPRKLLIPIKKQQPQRYPQVSLTDEVKWQGIVILTEHWKSDLEFYKTELTFLSNLIKKYLVWLTNDKDIESLRKMGVDLQLTEEKRSALLYDISKHRKNLIAIIENPFSHNSQASLDDHQRIERELSAFVKNFRLVKRKIFTLAERVIESGNIERMLIS